MKQAEKTKRTKEQIVKSAIEEFSANSYEAASINKICEKSGISKGLLYHNFKGKDELYLVCVKKSADAFLEYLKENYRQPESAKESIQEILTLRKTFFDDFPEYRNIFFSSILQPPDHLICEIEEIQRDFKVFNSEIFRFNIRKLSLREGLSEESAVNSFLIFSDMYNGYFQKKLNQKGDYGELMKAHDDLMSDMLNILLYGIIENGKER